MNKRNLLLLMLTFLWCVSSHGQYNPTNPGEPGVYYTLKLRCEPEAAGSFNIGKETIQSQGSGVNLRAYTNSGFRFVQWEENGKKISSSPSFSYTMLGNNTTLVAKFVYDPSSPTEPQEPVLPRYEKLSFEISPKDAGNINIASSNKYEVGSSVKLETWNNTNYSFVNWTQDGEVISTSKSFHYVVKEDNPLIVANYIYSPNSPSEPNKPTFQRRLYLNSNPQGGGYFNVSTGNTYTSGSTVALKAYSNKNYVFRNWTMNGDIISENYTLSFVMPETDASLVANFDYTYSPGNPDEPNSPAEQDLNIYGMTEAIFLGQTINYPIYLRNNQDVYGMTIDVSLPGGLEVDLNSLALSARGNGHTISYEQIENNTFRFSIVGDKAFSGDNGIVFEIPITASTDMIANTDYSISLTHGVIILKDGTKVPVLSRDGTLMVNIAAEGEIYARYSYDKFHNRVKFNNQSIDEVDIFEWDFGDGETSNEENPLHIYSTPGTYTVKLTVSNEEKSAQYEQRVLINDRSTWEASGNFYLTKQSKGLRDFNSYTDFLSMLSESLITGDININVESGYSFDCSDASETKDALSYIYQQLQQGNYKMVFLKANEGSNPIIEYGKNSILDFDKGLIDLIVGLGKNQVINGVDFKFWGIHFNPSELYRVVVQDVCTGVRTQSVDFSSISTDLQFSWNTTKKYDSLDGLIEKGSRSIPAMNIINKGAGDTFIDYMVTASYATYEFATFQVRIIVHPALNGLFSKMEPQNASQFENTNITLSWNNIENARYDVYLWNANEDGADEPIIESTSNIRVNISKYCQNGVKYKWCVRAHNNCQEIYSDTLSFNVGSLPDLHVSRLTVGNAVAGEEMEVSWTVTNDGNGPVNGEWSDNVWLVPDVYVGTSSVYSDFQRFHPKLLKTVGNMKALNPGESYENSVQIQLEERVYGDYWIIVTSDMHDVKNINWQAINNAVPNPYTPSITGSPYNYLYAETNANYNKVSEANESTTLSDNFNYTKINIAVPGLVDLSVTDVVAVVNNTPGTTTTNVGIIRVEPTPHTTIGLAESKEFYSGKWLKITATIKNIGALKLDRTRFSNAIYISHTPNRDNMDDLVLMETKDITTFIDPEGTAKVVFDVKMPFDWYGDTYFHVFADVNDAVYELAAKQNNWGMSGYYDFKLTPGADFLPSNLRAPNTIASQIPFNIQYDVKNIGPNIPTNSKWIDSYYLGKGKDFDETAVLVEQVIRGGYFSHTLKDNPDGPVLIPATAYTYYGDDYSVNTNITVKDVEEGDYYLFVKVDGDNQVLEVDGEDNNLIRSGMISCRKPNLQAEIISIDADTLLTSSTVSISWKVKNVGKGAVKNLKTKDVWYSSKNQDGANPIVLGEFENELFINPGDEQILRANVKIPQKEQLNGVQYIFMRINKGQQILETDYTDNQTSIIKQWFHFYQEKPTIIKGTNVGVDNISAPSQGKPNESISLSYLLKNDGNKKVDREIAQEVYLSARAKFDNSAVKCRVISQQGSSLDLGAEDETRMTLNVEIPDNQIGGAKYLYVVVDKNNELQETYTTDNCGRVSFYMNGNLPLIELSEVQIPDTIMSSDNITIKWKTANIGEWQAGSFKVGVFRSEDGQWDRQDERLATITIPYLAEGALVNNSTTINIPDQNHGRWNIFIKADYDDKVVQLEKNAGVAVKLVTVALSPLPDLVTTSLVADGTAWSGQKITLTTRYKNQGKHATRQTRWSEDFYLAQSNILNTHTATKIGSRVHVGALKPGAEYKSVQSLTLPPDIEGNYMIFAVADGGDAVYESDENNNLRSIPLFINGRNVCATDLTVSNISVPSKINAGEIFTLEYNINNLGEFQAKGLCREVVYLSKDDILDVDDPIVGTISGDISVMPGSSATRSASGRITNVPEGRYYIIVKANATRSIAELNDENNATILASQVDIIYPSITLDGTTTFNTSGYYKLSIPDGFENRTIGFYLNQSKENTGALYVAYESVPSTATYDDCSTRPAVEQQEVVISNVRKGNYYILAQDNSAVVNRDNLAFSLDGEESAKDIPLTLSTKELHFGASSLSIHEGGNGGWISTNIKGAFLDSIMDFRLVNKENMIPVEILHFKNSTSSVATFNLNNAEVGQYDVVSELPDGTTSILPGAFSVVPSTSVNVEVRLEAPEQFRPHTYTPMTLYYFNNGTNDVELYEFMITLEYGYIAATMDELDRNKQKVLHVRPDYERNSRGYISLPPGERIAFTFFIYNGANEVNDMIVYVVK